MENFCFWAAFENQYTTTNESNKKLLEIKKKVTEYYVFFLSDTSMTT